MRLGVISDTHGHLGNTRAAVAQLAGEQVDVIIHCGDIGSPQLVPLFAGWPAHFVLGNMDDDVAELRAAIEHQGMHFHGRKAELTLEGKSIAVLHGDDAAALSSTIDSGKFDLVCCGHTHQSSLKTAGHTLVLNPGALYRANPKTFAVVEWPAARVRFVPLRIAGD